MNVFVMQQMVKGQPVAVKPETVALTAGDALNKLSAQTGLNGDVLARQGWQAVQLVAVSPAVIAQAQANEAQLGELTGRLAALEAKKQSTPLEPVMRKAEVDARIAALQADNDTLSAQLAALQPAPVEPAAPVVSPAEPTAPVV